MSELLWISALAALVLAPPAAARTSGWSSLGTSGQLNVSDLVGTARLADGTLYVAWPRRDANGLYDLMQTPVSASGRPGTPAPIVSGWASVEGPTLLTSGSAIFAFFSGTQTLVTGDPHEGVDNATSTDRGASWALAPTAIAAGDLAGQRDASVVLGPAGVLTAWYAGEETVVHFGTDPMTINQRGYGLGTNQMLATSGGSALVAWCTSVQGPNGVFVQPVAPGGGAPGGPARIVPGSTSMTGGTAEAYCPATTRVPLVARQDKGFFVATVDGTRRTVSGWTVGASKALTLAGGSSFKQYLAAAASPGAKASVWVGWADDDGHVLLRRSNGSASVFGATVKLAGPRDGSIFGLDLNAQADRVDLVARVEHDDGTVTLETTQSYPGLTLVATSGRRPSFRVLDAGEPVAGARVTVAGHSGTTDAGGRVRIAIGRPGRYTAHTSAPKYVGASARVTVRRT